jgi:hypothetical protein
MPQHYRKSLGAAVVCRCFATERGSVAVACKYRLRNIHELFQLFLPEKAHEYCANLL